MISSWAAMRGSLVLCWGLGLFLVGCGEDPVLKAAREEASSEAVVEDGKEVLTAPGRGHPMDGGIPNGGMAPGEQQPGIPEEPKPGDPSSPSPGGLGVPEDGRPTDPEPGIPTGPVPVAGEDPKPVRPQEDTPPSGPTVSLSGNISFDDYSRGTVRIDVFDGEHHGGGGSKRPSLVTSLVVPRLGAWSVDVEQSIGQVWIEASNDENENGRPDPRDPMGRCSRNPVSTQKDTTGLKIHIERREELDGRGDDL
ncbi:MAG: hypothetical protein VX519_06865 [Myxococcota bacterium]|nr:hypothetical protein [Myxococcota bacterium]